MKSEEMTKRKTPSPFKLPAEEFEIIEGQCLTGPSCLYSVQSFLGEGSFGKVAKCWNFDADETVAVKIFKLGDDCIKDAEKEMAMLKRLRQLDPEKCNIVRYHEHFMEGNHPCVVFEMLDISLHDFMNQRQCAPLPLKDIRSIIQQLATAFQALKTIGLIHSDLKPDNIMLVDHVRQPFRVKLIDFGLAKLVSQAKCGRRLQPIWWRSPEIILGLPYSEAIDMWSLGCVMAGLILGLPLYRGRCEYDVLRYITHTHGHLPNHMLREGVYTSSFFWKEMQACRTVWKLKTRKEYKRETGIRPTVVKSIIFSSLDDLEKSILPCDQNGSEKTNMMDGWDCVNLVKRMLTLDPARRISPSQVLEHAFITRTHLQRNKSQHDTDKGESMKGKKKRQRKQKRQNASVRATSTQLNPGSSREGKETVAVTSPMSAEDLSATNTEEDGSNDGSTAPLEPVEDHVNGDTDNISEADVKVTEKTKTTEEKCEEMEDELATLKKALGNSVARWVQQASEIKALKEEKESTMKASSEVIEGLTKALLAVEAEKERLALENSILREEKATLATKELSNSRTENNTQLQDPTNEKKKNVFKRMWRWISGKMKKRSKHKEAEETTACLTHASEQ